MAIITPQAAKRCAAHTLSDQLAQVREQLERDTARQHAKAKKILDMSDVDLAFEADELDFPTIDWRHSERFE